MSRVSIFFFSFFTATRPIDDRFKNVMCFGSYILYLVVYSGGLLSQFVCMEFSVAPCVSLKSLTNVQ